MKKIHLVKLSLTNLQSREEGATRLLPALPADHQCRALPTGELWMVLKSMFDILTLPDNFSCCLHHDCKHNKTLTR